MKDSSALHGPQAAPSEAAARHQYWLFSTSGTSTFQVVSSSPSGAAPAAEVTKTVIASSSYTSKS
jgi:hypothetical protein